MREGWAILKYDDNFYSIKCELRKRQKAKLKIEKLGPDFSAQKDRKYTLSLPSSSGFLVALNFPFKERKKIELVLKSELEPLLPFPSEDIVTDFINIEGGNILSLSVQKSLIDELRSKFKPAVLTLNSLSSLYALQFFGIIKEDSYSLLHMEEDSFVLFRFHKKRLESVRQSFFDLETIYERIRESFAQGRSGSLYLIGNERRMDLKKAIESNFEIEVRLMKPENYIDSNIYPDWVWAACGASLLSLSPEKHINLLREEGKGFLNMESLSIAVSIVLTLSFLAFIASYINLNLKERAYRDLAKEELKIYRSLFSGSPPVGQIEKILQEKLKGRSGEGQKTTSISPLFMLSEISKNIDESVDVKLSSFNMEENKLSISGTTVSLSNVERIREGLMKIRNVKEVIIESVEPSVNQVKFKIRCEL